MPEIVRILVRIPKDVWEQMKVWAEEENRSLNGQIVYVLRRALQRRDEGIGD